MFKKLFAVAGVFVLASVPRLAAAQDQPNSENESPAYCPPGTSPVLEPGAASSQVSPQYPQQPLRRPVFSPFQTSLSVGGGVGNFVRDRIADLQHGPAGAWDARLLFGTRSYLGMEATYLGTAAGGASDIGTGSVVTTQVSGALRFNMTRSRIQPFLLAGAGWANLHRSASADIAAVPISRTTNSFEVPFGAGISSYISQHAVLDVRGGYNLITNKDFTLTGARPDMWTAEMRLGYAF